MEPRRFEESSRLEGASQAEIWKRVTSWEGVNHELGPLFKMSHPARFPTAADVPADGESHMTSILLLFGVIPFDAHRLAFRGLVAPEFFDECSSNGLMKTWLHHRSVTPVEGGVVVRDRCGVVPRIPGTGALLERIYRAVFRRRHRRLRAWWEQAREGR